MHPLGLREGEETNSHQRGVSRVRDFRFALTISGIREAGADIIFREIWELPQESQRGSIPLARYLLILKHVWNWSYDTLEREVRANLVYRAFTRIGDEKVPDAKTLARLGQKICLILLSINKRDTTTTNCFA